MMWVDLWNILITFGCFENILITLVCFGEHLDHIQKTRSEERRVGKECLE